MNDLSNSYIGITGYTNPSDLRTSDISQNNLTTTKNTVKLLIYANQISGSADISGYDIDISAGSGWVTDRNFDSAPLNGPTQTSTITISSLTAYTLYDISVNMANTHGYTNNKTGSIMHTAPDDFANNDISQNMNDLSTNKISLNVKIRHLVIQRMI